MTSLNLGLALCLLILLSANQLLAEAGNQALTEDDEKMPSMIHIALAGEQSLGIAISWSTQVDTATSVVKLGTETNKYTMTATGASTTYWESYHHHVVIGNLIPDTVYYYVVGSDDTSNVHLSEERSFRSAPLPTKLHEEEWKFIVYGDLGVVNGKPTAEWMGDNYKDVDLVWHSGDVGYADDSFLHFGCYTKFCYEEKYDEYMERIQDRWAAHIPYMVMPGNHEADCHSPACMFSKEKREKLSNFTALNHRFRMPSDESNGTANMWYSFDYGNVHYVSIDTETAYPDAPEAKRYVMPCGGFAGDMLTWLEEDLKKANLDVNRAERPWVFVAGHRPIYESTLNNTFPPLQDAIEDLLYKYGVDVYFAGHRHYYVRYNPLYKGEEDPRGYNNPRFTTHLTAGGPGNDEMDDIVRRRRELEEVVRDKAAGVERPLDLSPHEDSAAGRQERARESKGHLSQRALGMLDSLLKTVDKEQDAGIDSSISSGGGGGGGLGGLLEEQVNALLRAEDPDNFSANGEKSSWVAQWDKDNHVGLLRVHVQGSNTLRIDYVRTTTGEVFDSVTLTRDDESRGLSKA